MKGFTKPTQGDVVLKPSGNIFQNRAILGKEGRDKTGLGCFEERRINNSPVDPTSLCEPRKGATPEGLNKLEYVQMVYHSALNEDIMLYFMTDGRVYQIRKDAINQKHFEELEHVLFLFKVKNKATDSAARYLKTVIEKQKS